MSEVNYEIIQQYLSGELSAEDAAAFEGQMKSNPELAREVQLYKTIDDEMKGDMKHSANDEQLKQSLKNLTNEFFETPKAKVVSLKKYWWIAAAAAAIIAFIVLRPAANQVFDNEKLYAYYTQDAAQLSEGTRGGNDDTLIEKAVKLFNKKEYKQALPLMQQAAASRPDDTELYLSLGYCYMQSGNIDTALTVFNKVSKGNTVYKNQAIWYKALLLLKENKVDECYSILQSIPKDADSYKEAKGLIKKIEKR
jgi:tetratricopeptide (TPR) repeat protein